MLAEHSYAQDTCCILIKAVFLSPNSADVWQGRRWNEISMPILLRKENWNMIFSQSVSKPACQATDKWIWLIKHACMLSYVDDKHWNVLLADVSDGVSVVTTGIGMIIVVVGGDRFSFPFVQLGFIGTVMWNLFWMPKNRVLAAVPKDKKEVWKHETSWSSWNHVLLGFETKISFRLIFVLDLFLFKDIWNTNERCLFQFKWKIKDDIVTYSWPMPAHTHYKNFWTTMGQA